MSSREEDNVPCNVSLLQAELCVLGDWLQIPSANTTLEEKLREGAFGEVYKGLVGIDGKSRECAVKKLKGKRVHCLYLMISLVFSQ